MAEDILFDVKSREDFWIPEAPRRLGDNVSTAVAMALS